MGVLKVKSGVLFGPHMMPAGARILEALKALAPTYDFDVVITSAFDGVHSGPKDPHKTFEAIDVRSNTLSWSQKQRLLKDIQALLYTSTPRRFYAFLEAGGLPNEHIHIQRRAGTQYDILAYLSNL